MILCNIINLNGIKVGGHNVNTFRYADDAVLITDLETNLQEILQSDNLQRGILAITKDKKDRVVVSKKTEPPQCVTSFAKVKISSKSINSNTLTTDGKCETEIKKRIIKSKDTFRKLATRFNNKNITVVFGLGDSLWCRVELDGVDVPLLLDTVALRSLLSISTVRKLFSRKTITVDTEDLFGYSNTKIGVPILRESSMVLIITFVFLTSMVAESSQLTCLNNSRSPEYNDISATCGTSSVSLAIIACPVYYSGYNESQLILNQGDDAEQCKGTLDESITTPVIRFTFPLNKTSACGSTFVTTSATGTGIFADFSNIETVNISGVVRTDDITLGVITYNAELKYYYSCSYPLEYLINNTQVDVSSNSIAVTTNNGSFISTLSIQLYSDENYTTPMIIPAQGLQLRTDIFVQVEAVNLTDQYHVLLDRCYASISPHPINSTFHNLFVGCDKDLETTIIENGESHRSRFSIKAFRFLEQQADTVSTYYLHCITRLCEVSTCSNFKCNRRRRREVDTTELSDATTLSSRAIVIKNDNLSSSSSDTQMSVGMAVGVLVLADVLVAAAAILKRLRHL
ncbi:LOW QUALITY PROTEIN: zona pellucida-like domain-containing protein 1 [Pholidichthys leucotaenia]